MTQKFAFMLVKAMEIYAFRHSKNHKINDYSLLYFSVSDYGNYKLVISADWLYEMRHKEVLLELYEIFKNVGNLPMFSIAIEKGNIGNKDIDGLIRLAHNYGAFHQGYFIPTHNIPLQSGMYEEGYILTSKILPNMQFGKEFWVSIRDKERQKLIPISFQKDAIHFLNENGISLFNTISDKSKLYEMLLNPMYYFEVNIFDIYNVETENSFEKMIF